MSNDEKDFLHMIEMSYYEAINDILWVLSSNNYLDKDTIFIKEKIAYLENKINYIDKGIGTLIKMVSKLGYVIEENTKNENRK